MKSDRNECKEFIGAGDIRKYKSYVVYNVSVNSSSSIVKWIFINLVCIVMVSGIDVLRYLYTHGV